MRKLFFLLAGVALLAACEKEPNVAPKVEDEAKQMTALDRYLQRVAEEGIAMLGDTPTRAGARRVIDLSRTRAFVKATTRSEEDTLFYVVNFADSTGFALVDANMESPAPLIAVTEQGNYTPGEVTNSGFDLYMDMLSQNSTRGILPDVEIDSLPYPDLIIKREIEDYYTDWIAKGPYVHVKWGQDSPYNLYCLNTLGQTCPAGCVAIAVAQIFSSHCHPSTFTVTFNESNTNYSVNWMTMNSHIGAPTGSGCSSICTDHQDMQYLIREIGEQVYMDYQTTQSGAYSFDVFNVLSHFSYNYNVGLRVYAYSLAKSDLDLGRSLYMSGVRSGGAHAWLLDGYKERSHVYRVINHYGSGESKVVENTITNYAYLHVNWGWNGMNNGYFLEGVFNIADAYEYDTNVNSPLVRDYNTNLRLITGITPATN